MKVEIRVPQLGLTTEYVILKRWLVKVGQTVKKSMPVAEVESEKVTLEIESPADGILTEFIAQPEEELKVQQVMGYIEMEV